MSIDRENVATYRNRRTDSGVVGRSILPRANGRSHRRHWLIRSLLSVTAQSELSYSPGSSFSAQCKILVTHEPSSVELVLCLPCMPG